MLVAFTSSGKSSSCLQMGKLAGILLWSSNGGLLQPITAGWTLAGRIHSNKQNIMGHRITPLWGRFNPTRKSSALTVLWAFRFAVWFLSLLSFIFHSTLKEVKRVSLELMTSIINNYQRLRMVVILSVSSLVLSQSLPLLISTSVSVSAPTIMVC